MQLSNWADDSLRPVDPETFVRMSLVYDEGARTNKLKRGSVPGLYLTDIPMNRGMLAVVGALRSIDGLIGPMQAYLCRLMHMDDLFARRDVLGEFIKEGMERETLMVADELFMAAAVAKLAIVDEKAQFDLPDLLTHAHRFAAEGTEPK